MSRPTLVLLFLPDDDISILYQEVTRIIQAHSMAHLETLNRFHSSVTAWKGIAICRSFLVIPYQQGEVGAVCTVGAAVYNKPSCFTFPSNM